MEKPRNDKTASDQSPPKKSGATLGLRVFEKISAVEGVSLTEEMREDLFHIQETRMGEAQRSQFLNDRYGKQ